VLDAEGVTHVDSAGLQALADLSDDLRREGIGFHIARMKSRPANRVRGHVTADGYHGTVRVAVESCDPGEDPAGVE
jgi:MFS superfamily sulfate permease-like transporter